MEILTSIRNPRVMTWKSLKERKGRRETGLFLAEGRKMTEEALESGFPVQAVLLNTDGPEPFTVPEGVPVYGMPGHIFSAICDTRTPQGIAAVVATNGPRRAMGKRLLVLDAVQDPGNVGTMIRTADAAGFEGVLMSGECADAFSPKVLRATMGSIFRVPLQVADDLPRALNDLKAEGSSILSTQLDGTPFYDRQGVNERFCLVIGNEGNGISEPVRALATHHLRLPMRGGAESLNAAVAAGIMMYDLTRSLDA